MGLSDAARALATRSPQPDWIAPMLATLTHQHFSADGWIFERKLDGERCLAYCKENAVQLLSRNRRDLNATYPEIADAIVHATRRELVLDGEVVAFERGRTSFILLQQRMGISNASVARRSRVAVSYYLFDLLHLDGWDVRKLPLRTRKVLLRRALSFQKPLHLTAHRNREGERYLMEACAHAWEGLIAKRADSPYISTRSPDWLKFRCSNQQEFVVGGFTDPLGSRVGLGALLLGVYDRGKLSYAGRVGTGFDTATLLALRARLERLQQRESPFAQQPTGRERGVHWTQPELVAQIAFTEWTEGGLLRHPRYLGLRDDKPSAEVARERPWRPSQAGPG
jgi:bifunctional non-homologous end joining protein LigD